MFHREGQDIKQNSRIVARVENVKCLFHFPDPSCCLIQLFPLKVSGSAFRITLKSVEGTAGKCLQQVAFGGQIQQERSWRNKLRSRASERLEILQPGPKSLIQLNRFHLSLFDDFNLLPRPLGNTQWLSAQIAAATTSGSVGVRLMIVRQRNRGRCHNY